MNKAVKTPPRKKSAAPIDPPAREWNALIVKLGNGFTYIVSRVALENDYAEDIMQSRGVTHGVALESARSANVKFWFNEQWAVDEVVATGLLIHRPTYEEAMFAAMNGAVAPSIDDVKEVFL